MESLKIGPEEVREIKEKIELNSFVTRNLGSVEVGGLEPGNLLTVEEIELEKEKHIKRDGFFERFSISTLLKFCLSEKTFKIKDGFIEIESGIDLKLPEGYGFKGGAARTALRQSLGLRNHEPRDYDLIRTTETEPYDGADRELALKYMEKDFELGDGVEVLDNSARYFQTRDFSINEVYVMNNRVYATEECIRDTLRGIVRVTDFELENYYHGYVGLGPKMKAKALRFHVEQLHTTGVSEIYVEDIKEIENSFINPFWIAVQLDRAFERSVFIANKFTELLIKLNIIPNDIVDAVDLVEYLKEEIDGDFYFRSVPEEIYQLEDDFAEQEDFSEELYWEEYYDALR